MAKRRLYILKNVIIDKQFNFIFFLSTKLKFIYSDIAKDVITVRN
jgi:hypothetical protein